MAFRIPEPVYPLSISTIGMMLAFGHEMTVHCHSYGCGHRGRVNLVQLSRKLGMGHSTLEKDLKEHFYCAQCREAGRDPQDISFIHHAMTLPYSAWPRDREEERQRSVSARRTG